jgi:dihydroorotate dehydrogenase (NAD+) catalytic subunit
MGRLDTNLAGIALRNPVILAAGTCGILDEMREVIDLSRLGALTTKSITPQPREGNQTWRILPAGQAGMLNAIGLANPGLDAFIASHAPRCAKVPCPVFVSIAGFSIEDYHQCAANIDAFVRDAGGPGAANIHALELNVSCPNVRTGVEFGHTAGLIGELLSVVRPAVTACKVFVKLSPAAPHLMDVCRAAIAGGADALTLGNTYPAMAIDVETRQPKLANVTGGLSGPAVHPIALKHVYDAHRLINRPARDAGRAMTPLIGLGGVTRWQDAAEFVLAGATAVQLGTTLLADPRSPYGIIKGLDGWVGRQARDAGGISSLIGDLVLPV